MDYHRRVLMEVVSMRKILLISVFSVALAACGGGGGGGSDSGGSGSGGSGSGDSGSGSSAPPSAGNSQQGYQTPESVSSMPQQ
jgi:hypothetical protein